MQKTHPHKFGAVSIYCYIPGGLTLTKFLFCHEKAKCSIFTRLALIVALSTAGYLGGMATVAPPSVAETTEEEDCERDKCKYTEQISYCIDRWWPWGNIED